MVKVLVSLAKNMPTFLVLLDLSAAFDTLDHDQLLSRLNKFFGVQGVALDWFRSYLTNRRQSVKVNSNLSKSCPLSFGVPQGSVLGPLLFTLFTAPLSSIISQFSNIKHHLYADDTQIYISITPENAASTIPELQSCLSAVQKWMNSNLLKLNPDKTEFIVFGSKHLRSKLSNFYPIEILGNSLVPVDTVKNLGVKFDSSFNFSAQVSSICSSCHYNMRDFARIRPYLSKSMSITVANALVGSRIDYCNSLLSNISKFDLKRLQSLQYSLCRIIHRIPKFSRVHMSPYLKTLHWLPVEQRIEFKWLLLIFKIVKLGLPSYFTPYFTRHVSGRTTRRSTANSMFLSRCIIPYNSKIFKSKSNFDNCFYTSGPAKWNALPDNIRGASTLSCFRSRLKTYLFNKAYPP